MDLVGKVVTGTGHRPNKLGGHGRDVFERLVQLAIHAIKRLEPKELISGMALGWDQALVEACIRLRFPFAAYVPFAGQESKWPEDSRRTYDYLMAHASRIVVVCDGGYAAWKMQKRNQRMCDDADLILALFDGSTGGTGNCVQYAKSIKRPVLNVWERWRSGDF